MLRSWLNVAVVAAMGLIIAIGGASASANNSQWFVATLAGSDEDPENFPDDLSRTDLHLQAESLVVDPAGSGIYFTSDVGGVLIRRVIASPEGTPAIETVAGSLDSDNSEDGPATERRIFAPRDMEFDPTGGGLYFIENRHFMGEHATLIRRLTPGAGGRLHIETVVGDLGSNNREDGLARQRRIDAQNIMFDSRGVLYFLEHDGRIRRLITGPDGHTHILTIAGSTTATDRSDGPATERRILAQEALIDPHSDQLYFRDWIKEEHAPGAELIRRLVPAEDDDGFDIETVAGSLNTTDTRDGPARERRVAPTSMKFNPWRPGLYFSEGGKIKRLVNGSDGRTHVRTVAAPGDTPVLQGFGPLGELYFKKYHDPTEEQDDEHPGNASVSLQRLLESDDGTSVIEHIAGDPSTNDTTDGKASHVRLPDQSEFALDPHGRYVYYLEGTFVELSTRLRVLYRASPGQSDFKRLQSRSIAPANRLIKKSHPSGFSSIERLTHGNGVQLEAERASAKRARVHEDLTLDAASMMLATLHEQLGISSPKRSREDDGA